MNKFKYIQSFDSIRGIATLFVLLIHGSYGFFKGAWIALDLFFVLSGYLITSLLQGEYLSSGTISLSKFYIRRGLKILPPLLICIILANILWSVTDLNMDANRSLSTAGALFYFTNFLQVKVTGNMIHLWSLSVEEHFYFFWPLIMLFLIPKISFRKSIILLIIVALISTVCRIIAFNFHFSGNTFIIDSFRSTFCRVDSIILGVLLSFFLNKNPWI